MADMPNIEKLELGEMDEGEEDSSQIIENDDGSVTVIDPNAPESEGTHLENLAEKLSEMELTTIANELLELIEIDKDSRKESDELYKKGLQNTGLGEDAPGGADFAGASRAVHPVLAEACVDYSSSAIKEIFPPDGPVKIHNFAENIAPNDIERAEAKRDFLNWQLVEQIREYRSELEILLTQMPLAGTQYLKIWFDPSVKRICTEFVPSDMMIRPYASSSLMTTGRFALIVPLTELDYKRRIKSGFYRDVELQSEPFLPEQTEAQAANDKIEGKSQPIYNRDGLRNFFEVYVEYDIGDGEVRPYIITIDEYSQKVVAIYRNWEEDDPEFKRLDWVVDFNFIPWRGAGGVGLTHLIGSLAGSATGALRALMDSAHLNNFPGAVKLKGTRASGQTVTINATEVTEIDAPAGTDDIRKVMMSLPFNPPSTVLFQLLGFIVDAAKGVVSTAEEKIADANNQMPVGTTLALIEQGSKVASAIHMRLHEAQKRVFAIIQRLNFKHFDPQLQVKKFGRVLVAREEFLDTGNIVPVSDPYMFSEAQRFAQIQGVLQMAQDPSVPWNKLAIYKRLLRVMHVPSPQEFIQEPPPPVSADPVTEIVAAMSGAQVAAKPEMDHWQHIDEHLRYLLDPVFGAANPSLMNPGFATIMNDVAQHFVFAYQQLKMQAAQMAQQQVVQMIMMRVQGAVPPEMIQQSVAQLLQSPQVTTTIAQLSQQMYAQQQVNYQPYVAAMQQASELLKAKAPPMTDPQSQTAIQIAQMQEQTKLQLGNLQMQADMQAQERKAKHEAAKLELEKLIKTVLNPQTEQTKLANERLKNEDDNRQHQMTELIKNNEDNQTELEIANIREQGETDRKLTEMYQQAAMGILDPNVRQSPTNPESSAQE